jgi:hypothetical protein
MLCFNYVYCSITCRTMVRCSTVFIENFTCQMNPYYPQPPAKLWSSQMVVLKTHIATRESFKFRDRGFLSASNVLAKLTSVNSRLLYYLNFKSRTLLIDPIENNNAYAFKKLTTSWPLKNLPSHAFNFCPSPPPSLSRLPYPHSSKS